MIASSSSCNNKKHFVRSKYLMQVWYTYVIKHTTNLPSGHSSAESEVDSQQPYTSARCWSERTTSSFPLINIFAPTNGAFVVGGVGDITSCSDA